MTSVRVTLAYCGVIGLLWLLAPAITVGHGFRGLKLGAVFWCLRSDALHIWDPLPSHASLIPETWYAEWPEPVSVHVAVPYPRDAAQRSLADARRAWLTRSALQATLLGLLLCRHHCVTLGARRLAGALRRRLAQPAFLVLLLVVTTLLACGVLFSLGPHFGWCRTRIEPPVGMAPDIGPLLDRLAGYDATGLAPNSPPWVILHAYFNLLVWLSVPLTVLLLLVSWLPGSRRSPALLAT